MYILSRLVDYPIPAIGRGTIPTHPKSFFQKYHRLNEHQNVPLNEHFVSIVHCILQISCKYRANFARQRKIWTKNIEPKIGLGQKGPEVKFVKFLRFGFGTS